MPRLWPTQTHLPVALCVLGVFELAGSHAAAQADLGRALTDPHVGSSSAAASGPAWGRELGDPSRGPAPLAEPEPGWAVDLEATTALPLSVGLRGTVTSPIGLFAQLELGHVPNAYLDMMASALGDAGVYRDHVRPLIDDAISDGGWTVRASLGLVAFDGLELVLGYTNLTTQTGLSPSAVEAALNRNVPWPSGMGDIPLSLSLHAVHGRVGWRFVVEEHLVIRVGLGWTHTVAADAHLEVPPELREIEDDPATRMEQGVREGLSEYGFAPTLDLGVGYRF